MLVAEVEVESLRVTFGRVGGDIFDLGIFFVFFFICI